MELKQFFIYLISFIIISCSLEKNVRTYKLEKNQISSESKSNDLKTDSSNELNYVKPETWIAHVDRDIKKANEKEKILDIRGCFFRLQKVSLRALAKVGWG